MRRFPIWFGRPRFPAARPRRPFTRLGLETLDRRDVPTVYNVTIGTAAVKAVPEGSPVQDATAFLFDAAIPGDPTRPDATRFKAHLAYGDGKEEDVPVERDPSGSHVGVIHMTHLYQEASTFQQHGQLHGRFDGMYLVTLTLTDPAGERWPGQNGVTVSDAAITAERTDLSVNTNVPFDNVVAVIHDTNPYAEISDFADTTFIVWSDGAQTPPSGFHKVGPGEFWVCGAHTYTRADNYSVGVYIGDIDTVPQHHGNAIVTSHVHVTDLTVPGQPGTAVPPDAAAPSIKDLAGLLGDVAAGMKAAFDEGGAFESAKWAKALDGLGTVMNVVQAGAVTAPLAPAIEGPRDQFIQAGHTATREYLKLGGSVGGAALAGALAEFITPLGSAILAEFLSKGGEELMGSEAAGALYDKYLKVPIGDFWGAMWDWRHGVTHYNKVTLTVGGPCQDEGPAGGLDGGFDGDPFLPKDPTKQPFQLHAEVNNTIPDGDDTPPLRGPIDLTPTVGGIVKPPPPPTPWQLLVVPVVPGDDEDDPGLVAAPLPILATRGQPWTGSAVDFRRKDGTGGAGDFTASIGWGDGSLTPGAITPDGQGGFLVSGTHTFPVAGTGVVAVLITDVRRDKQLLTLAGVRVIEPPPPGDPVTADVLAVDRAYRELLGRPASGADVNYWLGQLNQGAPHGTLAASLVASPEYRANQVQSYYDLLLGRPASPSEENFWSRALAGGASDQQVLAAVLASPEYAARTGGSDTGFVTGLYDDLLVRDPSPADLDYWTKALAAGTPRSAVAAAVLGSPEYQYLLAKGLYGNVLQRAGDAPSVAATAAALGRGATVEQITAGLAGSPEFARLDGASGDQRFVERAYRDALGREADPAALGYYTDRLESGAMTRPQVAAELLASAEHRTRVVQQQFEHLLHRPASDADVTAYGDLLARGGSAEQIGAALAGSAEYLQARGSGTVNGFLVALYQDLLRRPPEAAALDYWGRQLAGGMTRGQVAAAVMSSTEYLGLKVDDLFRTYLHRPADAAARDADAAALRAGVGEAALALGLMASPEYSLRL